MLGRFEGSDGKRRLIDALRDQRLIEHDEALATSLADSGELINVAPGTDLIVQGHADNDIYFIIDGEATVFVNRRPVAVRYPRESLGEMAMIDPAARRSATVAAKKSLTVLKVSEGVFRGLIKDNARVWRSLAIVIAERLRQRERFHRPPNDMPVLFVGSSVEGLPVVRELQLGMKHDRIHVRPWTTPGVFGPGGVPLDSLLREVEASDFAAFIFGPDDKAFSRGEMYEAPRDNVVFELGLFMARLDRNRTFIIKEHSSEIKIPTDLLGIIPITYVVKAGEALSPAIAVVCTELRNAIEATGVL
jgi:CRP/FNR family transcriptional regulator, cyclic AMP receptor protein